MHFLHAKVINYMNKFIEIDFPEDLEYSSDGEYLPIEFYLKTIQLCKRIDLKLGYFSSNAIRTLSLSFAIFIYNGGELRLITNHFLSKTDKNIFFEDSDLIKDELFIKSTIENDIEGLADIINEGKQHFFDCLKYLHRHNKLEIIPVKLKPDKLAHYKQGILSDGEHKIYFNGSCNFTYSGLIENGESLSIFRSWGNNIEKIRIKKNQKEFDSIYNKTNKSYEYLATDDIIEVINKTGQDLNKDELLENEIEIINKITINPNLKKSFKDHLKMMESRIRKIANEPRFPFEKGPRKYQKIAFENWRLNNQQGLFAMATGTGKTITSLNCLLEIYKKTGYYKALILVPTITLINQWEDECRRFNFSAIIKIYSKNNWKDDFSALLTREHLFPTEQISYIVISTYASFSKQKTFQEINQLPVKTLLIADECHNMGSPSLLKILSKINCKRRIGLSATPERQYDEDGNYKLFSFFNSENIYTYEYSMAEAINNNVLCRYYYYPHLVSLTETEMNRYNELSLKIAKYFNPQKESFYKSDQILTNLLLARKRIIHKAHNKYSVFNEILREQYTKKKNLKYTLVYVPEGNDPNDYFETDIFSKKDETNLDNDAEHLIDVYTKAIIDTDKKTTVKKFISGTSSKDKVLEQFANGEIEVLTSMKCLDEGVDVPRAEFAIFCSSTGNPRQFIQRRGRILRKHDDKPFAYIHDLVVIPELNTSNDSFKMERCLLKKELERVYNFSSLAENSSHTINVLIDIMNYYNLNLYNND